MKLSIISGSQRQNSNSAKIGALAESYLLSSKKVSDCYHLRLEKHPLPLWDERISQEDSPLKTAWTPIHQNLKECDALVVITPEWHGMASPALKNFFLYCDNVCIAHKPALLISVSTGIGGSYPINEMRTSSYKNSRVCYIPDHLIIRRVQDFCAQYQKATDPVINESILRFHYCLDILQVYAQAFKEIRANETIAIDQFPNGL